MDHEGRLREYVARLRSPNKDQIEQRARYGDKLAIEEVMFWLHSRTCRVLECNFEHQRPIDDSVIVKSTEVIVIVNPDKRDTIAIPGRNCEHRAIIGGSASFGGGPGSRILVSHWTGKLECAHVYTLEMIKVGKTECELLNAGTHPLQEAMVKYDISCPDALLLYEKLGIRPPLSKAYEARLLSPTT